MGTWLRTALTGMVFGTSLLSISGCLATRDWVREQLDPVNGRLSSVDKRVDEVDAKADRALAGLGNLRLEDKLVLGMKEGATFGFNSAGLSKQAKGEIDRFFKEMEEREGGSQVAAEERVYVIAGHTDSVGKADYNYELGQRRAERVAGYLVSEKGVDPTRVHAVSYGDSKPLADNKSSAGRKDNRRIEILVYQQKVATASQ
jgi:outer membrane protein OmpA-like peptidoglycan-associated protein